MHTFEHKYTPGPWIVANGLQVWHDGHNSLTSPRICTIQNAREPIEQISDDERKANAYLIAAAPDLLHALELIYANAADHPDAIRAIIDRALEKARPRA